MNGRETHTGRLVAYQHGRDAYASCRNGSRLFADLPVLGNPKGQKLGERVVLYVGVKVWLPKGELPGW